eukprot:70021-Rhodomonas_salina.4
MRAGGGSRGVWPPKCRCSPGSLASWSPSALSAGPSPLDSSSLLLSALQPPARQPQRSER